MKSTSSIHVITSSIRLIRSKLVFQNTEAAAEANIFFLGPVQGVRPGAMQGRRPGAGGGFPFGSYAGSPSGEARQALRPGADVIALHEIHLARLSSLQVPVGHIPVPGGIKLCSPGTFGIANYLIINNGSCQVNFTKPNSATIRNTNSQWLRGDATEVPVGREAVPKTGIIIDK